MVTALKGKMVTVNKSCGPQEGKVVALKRGKVVVKTFFLIVDAAEDTYGEIPLLEFICLFYNYSRFIWAFFLSKTQARSSRHYKLHTLSCIGTSQPMETASQDMDSAKIQEMETDSTCQEMERQKHVKKRKLTVNVKKWKLQKVKARNGNCLHNLRKLIVLFQKFSIFSRPFSFFPFPKFFGKLEGLPPSHHLASPSIT